MNSIFKLRSVGLCSTRGGEEVPLKENGVDMWQFARISLACLLPAFFFGPMTMPAADLQTIDGPYDTVC